VVAVLPEVVNTFTVNVFTTLGVASRLRPVHTERVSRPRLPLSVLAVLVTLVPLGACGSDSVSGTPGSTSGSSGSSGSSGGTTFSSQQQQGIATYYDYSGSSGVACGYGVTSDTDIAAMDAPEYAGSAACGACFEVAGPKGKVTVRIVDLCPECEKGHLDLSAQAFAKIADPVAGRVSVTLSAVACNVTGAMSYEFKDGSSQYWTAIQVRNHRLPVTKVEYKKNGTFTDMPRADYNYFIDESGVGVQPNGITLRITAADGQTVEDSIPDVQAGKVVPGKAQFK
jgi:expansin (peptidoglycan-binding protein)